jgi:hypothetical protein
MYYNLKGLPPNSVEFAWPWIENLYPILDLTFDSFSIDVEMFFF